MRLNTAQRFQLMKLLEDLGKSHQGLTANEVQDQALAIGLPVEKGVIYHTAKRLGIDLRRERCGPPKGSKLIDLEAKIRLLETELQRVKDSLKRIYLDGFGVPYPEGNQKPEV